MQPSDEMAAAQVAIFAVVVGVFAVFAAFITFHFVNRRDQQPIKARYPALVLVQTAIVWIYVCLLCLSRIIYNRWPCWMSLWLGHVGLIVLANSYLVRCWILLVSHTITNYTMASKSTAKSATPIPVPFVMNYPILRSLPFMLKFLGALSVTMLIPAAIATARLPTVLTGYSGSCNRGFADLVLVVYAAIYIFVFAIFAYKLRNVIDGFYLKAELRLLAFVCILSLIPWYLFNNNAALKDFNDSQFPVTSVSLLVVLISAFILTTAMPLYFAVFTPPPPTVTIDQIKTLPALLETPEGYLAFQEFLKLEFALENLYFWKAVRSYRETAEQLKADTSKTPEENLATLAPLARAIHSDYIASTAPYEVNVPGDMNAVCGAVIEAAEAFRGSGPGSGSGSSSGSRSGSGSISGGISDAVSGVRGSLASGGASTGAMVVLESMEEEDVEMVAVGAGADADASAQSKTKPLRNEESPRAAMVGVGVKRNMSIVQAPVFMRAADAFRALTECFDASFETIVNLMIADSFKRFSVSAICKGLHAELQSKQDLLNGKFVAISTTEVSAE